MGSSGWDEKCVGLALYLRSGIKRPNVFSFFFFLLSIFFATSVREKKEAQNSQAYGFIGFMFIPSIVDFTSTSFLVLWAMASIILFSDSLL
ncbi:hypothetical protein BJ508DRAFT_163541 [Ascobolus immersus RN42]|uniref:Uncharacterized protein n=1 Tax=Ascobolus immersus RN42 TaxID=1160509 RepID=A0A3N4HXB0_ASCIM|nr:hypothetical protein BJ508DRAFT_163541 [Ascobolus immersus RN42]